MKTSGIWMGGGLLVFVVAFLGAGCDTPSTAAAASCVVSQSSGGGGGAVLCEEVSAAAVSQLEQDCAAGGGPDAGPTAGGQFANGPCPRAQALGGCRPLSSGVTVTYWYYPAGGLTAGAVQALCDAAGETFIAP